MNSYHLVHKDGEWKLEAKGARRATISFNNCTKKEAVKQSAEQLRHSAAGASLRIHGLDGRIQSERTYQPHSEVRKTSGPRGSGDSRRGNASGPRSGRGSSGRR